MMESECPRRNPFSWSEKRLSGKVLANGSYALFVWGGSSRQTFERPSTISSVIS